jgi:RNA polymerase sigma-70 factor, ECF subfamily
MHEEPQPLTRNEVASLYAEHGEAIRHFLTGILRDSALAADCLQATFELLLTKGGGSRPESRRGWLFTVAHQQAMLAKRKQATTDRVLRKAAWKAFSSGNATENTLPELASITKETIAQAQQALSQLPVDLQQIVILRIYEDKTFAVIAQELNIPLGTALWKMRTALEKLRQLLKH